MTKKMTKAQIRAMHAKKGQTARGKVKDMQNTANITDPWADYDKRRRARIKREYEAKPKRYLPIIRNKNEKGYVLTYSVFINGREFEYNTLREAKKIAIIIEDDDPQEVKKRHAELDKFLAELQKKNR